MNSRGKWGLLVCGVALPLAILAYFYGPAFVIYYKVKNTIKNYPLLARVPEPLPTKNISQPSGQKLAFFDVEFQVPWSGEGQTKQWQKFARIQFSDGQFVMFFDPSTRVDRIKVLAENNSRRDSERVFGVEAMRSNYAFMNAILQVTPKDISPWMPRVQLVRNCVFLMLKEAELANTQTGLFQFRNQRMWGFQKGDPTKSPSVVLDAFDDSDREYEIFVGRTTGTNGHVSQEDINLILSTLKPTQGSPQVDQKSRTSSGTN
jgi:hypothetical protein